MCYIFNPNMGKERVKLFSRLVRAMGLVTDARPFFIPYQFHLKCRLLLAKYFLLKNLRNIKINVSFIENLIFSVFHNNSQYIDQIDLTVALETVHLMASEGKVRPQILLLNSKFLQILFDNLENRAVREHLQFIVTRSETNLDYLHLSGLKLLLSGDLLHRIFCQILGLGNRKNVLQIEEAMKANLIGEQAQLAKVSREDFRKKNARGRLRVRGSIDKKPISYTNLERKNKTLTRGIYRNRIVKSLYQLINQSERYIFYSDGLTDLPIQVSFDQAQSTTTKGNNKLLKHLINLKLKSTRVQDFIFIDSGRTGTNQPRQSDATKSPKSPNLFFKKLNLFFNPTVKSFIRKIKLRTKNTREKKKQERMRKGDRKRRIAYSMFKKSSKDKSMGRSRYKTMNLGQVKTTKANSLGRAQKSDVNSKRSNLRVLGTSSRKNIQVKFSKTTVFKDSRTALKRILDPHKTLLRAGRRSPGKPSNPDKENRRHTKAYKLPRLKSTRKRKKSKKSQTSITKRAKNRLSLFVKKKNKRAQFESAKKMSLSIELSKDREKGGGPKQPVSPKTANQSKTLIKAFRLGNLVNSLVFKRNYKKCYFEQLYQINLDRLRCKDLIIYFSDYTSEISANFLKMKLQKFLRLFFTHKVLVSSIFDAQGPSISLSNLRLVVDMWSLLFRPENFAEPTLSKMLAKTLLGNIDLAVFVLSHSLLQIHTNQAFKKMFKAIAWSLIHFFRSKSADRALLKTKKMNLQFCISMLMDFCIFYFMEAKRFVQTHLRSKHLSLILSKVLIVGRVMVADNRRPFPTSFESRISCSS